MVRRNPSSFGRAVAVLLAATFLVGACGVESGGQGRPARPNAGEDDRLAAAREQTAELLPRFSGVQLEPDETRCASDEMAAGDFDLRAALSDPTAAGDDLRVEMVEIVLGCIRSPASSPWVLAVVRGHLSNPTMPTLTDDEVQCAAEVILDGPEPARTLMGTNPDNGRVQEQMLECLTPEHRSQALMEEGTGPQEPGDDERLDMMVDDCEAGDSRACDLLYANSSEASAYEDVALGCGGGTPTDEGFCAAETSIDPETGAAPEDHPGLDVLATDCEAGDLTACDLLYIIAPVGSDVERIGKTCGGRIGIAAVPDCRTRFG